jgi:GDP-L-fucose synthase|tara:strand:+ start:840 stop:1757 length:918 start_codon:yes stop_codon:yes gene_type:complete
MKILLTGGSGMVGRNILEHEKLKSHNLIAPSRKELDLLDPENIKSFLNTQKPDLVIHAAGKVGGIQANINNPIGFLMDNLKMGTDLIYSSFDLGIPYLINLASSCMYPKDAINPLNEEMILSGKLEPTNEGYALAKTISTRLCEYISKEDSSKRYKTIIPCNLYGRFDKFDPENSHLLPAIIQKIHNAKKNGYKKISIWGDGSARREFMYCRDLADFIFFAIENINKIPQNINVGIGHDYSITEYYKTVAKAIGFEGDFNYDVSKPVGMKQKLVDVTKIRKMGWVSKTPLEEGITETYKFFKESS